MEGWTGHGLRPGRVSSERVAVWLLMIGAVLLLALVLVACGQKVLPKKDPGEAYKPAPPGLFAVSSSEIDDYLPDLIAGRAVSDYALLPCFESFTGAAWLELSEKYEGDWWNPLLEAIRGAALSEPDDLTEDPGDQLLRSYYVGKAFLSADGAYSEGLAAIVTVQWQSGRTLCSDCLRQYFSVSEAARLRKAIIYRLDELADDLFTLRLPGSRLGLSLAAYPDDFPFGLDLAERDRKSYRAESFGVVTVVESDGLQVTYLNNNNGVYQVITIRAVKPGGTVAGTAIGDGEQSLKAKWPNQLKRFETISYDDEEWFGEDYEHAYAYSPEPGTRSTVFLIKDGSVCGIELIDGLDGKMY